MKKFASVWSFVFLPLAVSLLVSNCGMDAAQTNKPVATASASGATATAVSPATQPVVGGGAADYANGPTAMAATTDASQTNQPGASRSRHLARRSRVARRLSIGSRSRIFFKYRSFRSTTSTLRCRSAQDGNITLPLVGKSPGGRQNYS